MPNKCGVARCSGNYKGNKCRIFRLPRDVSERQKWLNALPPRADFVLDPDKFFICEKHWCVDTPMMKMPGGSTRPANPPNLFPNIPSSCLPTPKPTPRPAKKEDRQLEFFLNKDTITSFASFKPDRELQKKYKNVIISRSDNKYVNLFMTENVCSPLTLSAFKSGFNIPLRKILYPNNGLRSYTQFFEAVHLAINYEIPSEQVVQNVVSVLRAQTWGDSKKEKKIGFLARQLELLNKKQYAVSDYCFALEIYPHCNYEQLRDFLLLPSKRKLRSITSGIDSDKVLVEAFKKIQMPQQKNVFLLIDEVQIRPTVAFSGGVLSGMAENNTDSRATSMLCIMMKSLHRGPSVMLSVTPVHKLTSTYQFERVKEAAAAVEMAGGRVIGSITDNHKVNQQYCKLFDRLGDSCALVKHPLDNERVWFLLFDTVHLLKCIRNNWISEKCQKVCIEQSRTPASFADVRELYEAEKGSILKTTTLTQAAVNPSRLQLQNVQHVLRVFNEKVVAALELRGCLATAHFIRTVLNWWNTVNVSGKGQDQRLNDPHRAVQMPDSTNLQTFLTMFQQAASGHGASRIQCLTHDTKKALVQTMEGLIAVCHYLFTAANFKYVLLREIQSDRLEGEFSVYRQSTGANCFMTSGDVTSAFKHRLTRFAASYLQSIEVQPEPKQHTCLGTAIGVDDAASIEKCAAEVTLTVNEESSAAYVAGWLEKKCCGEVVFTEEEPLVTSEVKDFIHAVSRGSLSIPHACTFELVRRGLCFMKSARHRACCRKRLVEILVIVAQFNDIDIVCPKLFRHLANVLLSGMHNLEKDQQKNTVLLQTSVKKARLAD